MANKHETSPSRDQMNNGDQWMYETMKEIVKKEAQTSAGYRFGFGKLWKQATEAERLEFAKKTRFASEVPNYEELIRQHGEKFTQIFPTKTGSRESDIVYYFSPKE